MRYLEKTGKSVDSAVTEALIELGATRDQVNIEVVQKGSRGFLGIGAKPVKVKVTIKVEEDDLGFLQEPTQTKIEQNSTDSIKPQTKETSKIQAQSQVEERINNEIEIPQVKANQLEPTKEKTIIHADDAVSCAQAFLTKVLEEMGIHPSFETKVVDKRISIDISGNKMGLVIGKRGETLDSLQYLVNIVVNKGKEGYIKVILDTENYRARREETLRKVALKFAKKATEAKKPVALEPMNPYDRRIIHSVLQNSKVVKTHSEGREPFRKIIISPIGYTKNKKQ